MENHTFKSEYAYIASLVDELKVTKDSNVFAEIYSLTYKKQYYLALKYLKDEFLAQDAIQEAYISVLKNIDTLKNPMLFISWLNNITFRVCLNMLKKLNNQSKEVDFVYLSEQSFEDKSNNPEEIVGISLGKSELIKLVNNLSPHEEKAIILKYYHELKIEEIAEIMECSTRTVIRYLNKRKEELLKAIHKDGGSIDEYGI